MPNKPRARRKGIGKRQGKPFENARTKIYIQMRAYDRHEGRLRHVPGSTIVVDNYTPGQIYRVIHDALAAALSAARKAATDGKKQEAEGRDTAGGAVDYTPRWDDQPGGDERTDHGGDGVGGGSEPGD